MSTPSNDPLGLFGSDDQLGLFKQDDPLGLFGPTHDLPKQEGKTDGMGLLQGAAAVGDVIGSIPGAIAAGAATIGTGIGTYLDSGGDFKKSLDLGLKAGHETMGALTPSQIIRNTGELLGHKPTMDMVDKYRGSTAHHELIERPFGALTMGVRDLGSDATFSQDYETRETGANLAEAGLLGLGAFGLRGGRGKKGGLSPEATKHIDNAEAPKPITPDAPEGTINFEHGLDPFKEYGAASTPEYKAKGDPFVEPNVLKDPLDEFGPRSFEEAAPVKEATLAESLDKLREEQTVAKTEPFREGDANFPLRQEAIDNDPYVRTLQQEAEKAYTEAQRIARWAKSRGWTENTVRRFNEANEKVKESTKLAEDYLKDGYNVTTPDQYKGSMWLDKPRALPIEKTTRPHLGKPGLNKGKRGRQVGAIDFEGFMKEVKDPSVVDREGVRDRLARAKADWRDMVGKIKEVDIRAAADPARYRGELNSLREKQHALWQEIGKLEDMARVEIDREMQRRSPFKGPGKGQVGAIRFNDPEFLKFKDTLPANLKPEAKAMWKEMQRRKDEKAKALPAVRNQDTALKTLDNIPGLKHWTEEVQPIAKSWEELKAPTLNEADLPANAMAQIGRQLVSGAKLYGLGKDSTVVRYVAQGVDRVMRNSSKGISDFILDKTKGFKPAWERLSPEEFGHAWTVLKQHEGIKELSRAEMFDLGLSEKQVNAMEAYRRAENYTYDRINAGLAARGKPPIEKRLGHIPGRFRGDFVVKVTDAEGNLVTVMGAQTKWGAERLRTELSARSPELTYSEVKHEPMHRFSDASDVQAGYQQLMKALSEDDPRVAQLESIYGEFLNKQSYDTLGVKKHFKGKQGEAGEGVGGAEGFKEWKSAYENAQEGLRSTMNYMDHALKWAEAQIELGEVRKMLSDKDLKKAQPEAVRYAHAYMDQALGRGPKMARALDSVFDKLAETTGIGQSVIASGIKNAKYWFTAYHLGFGNAGFSLAQIVQPIQTMPSFMKVLQQKGAHANIIESYAHGNIDAAKVLWNLGEPTTLAKQAFEYAKDMQIVDPKFLDESLSWKDTWGNTRKAMDWIATKNMTYFEKIARTQAYMTWVHFLHATGEYKMGKKLYETAGWLTDNMMVDYRAHERPFIYKQAGLLGEAANSLTSYVHNFYTQAWLQHQMASGIDKRFVTNKEGRNVPAGEINSLGNKTRRAIGLDAPKMEGVKGEKNKGTGFSQGALMFYGTVFTLGGALALPGRENLDGLIKLINQMSPTRIPTTRELLLEQPDLLSFGPTSTLTGTDVTAKFSVADALPDGLTLAFPFVDTFADIGSAAMTAMKDPGKTSAMELAHALTPTGQKWITENYFKQGNMMLDTKPPFKGVYKRDQGDQNRRYLGLKSLPESKARHEVRTIREQDRWFADKRHSIMNKADRATLEQNYMKVAKLATDYIDAEGDPREFIQGVMKHVEDRHKSQLLQMLERAMRNPMKLQRMQKK